MKRLNANYGGNQVNETEHALNSVRDDFDITTCKNPDDLYQVTMESKKKARKNTANCASSKSNADDWGNLTEDSTEPEIKNLVDETHTPKSSHPKRSNSLSSVWSLSTKKNSSISELKSEICALEADVVEVKNSLNDDRHLLRQVKAWVERLKRPPTEYEEILYNDTEGSK